MLQTPFGRLWLIHGDIVSDTLAQGRHWDPHVYDAISPFLSGVVIEGGANVGALTMRFAQAAKYVIAWEPHPVLRACLSLNMKSLGLWDKVTIYEEGLYSKEVYIYPQATLTDSPSSWSWLPDDRGIRAGPISFMPATVTAIKLDVKGADLHAMLGLEKVILRDHPAIIFEYENNLSALHGHQWPDYKAKLDEWGYTIMQVGSSNDFLCVVNP